MKKILSLTLAILLVLSLSVPALADTNVSVTNGTGESVVTATVNSSFTVIIPSATTLTGDLEQKEYNLSDVTLKDDSQMEPNAKVTISYAAKESGNTLKNSQNVATTPISYTLGQSFDLDLSDVSNSSNVGTPTLTVATDPATVKAGTYSDTLTFTVVYSDGNP